MNRTTIGLCALGLATSCTISARGGVLGCEDDADCPNPLRCRRIDASQTRCVDPKTPAWQAPYTLDAGVDGGHDSGMGFDASVTPATPDSGRMAHAADASTRVPQPDAARIEPPAVVDSGLRVTGSVWLLAPTRTAGDAGLRVTDAVLEAQQVAIGGGGCSAGCGNNNSTLAETTRIDEKAYVWRVSCSDSTGKRVRCSGEFALCMKVSQ